MVVVIQLLMELLVVLVAVELESLLDLLEMEAE